MNEEFMSVPPVCWDKLNRVVNWCQTNLAPDAWRLKIQEDTIVFEFDNDHDHLMFTLVNDV
jgi:ActR/RegA family two-component response regulator